MFNCNLAVNKSPSKNEGMNMVKIKAFLKWQCNYFMTLSEISSTIPTPFFFVYLFWDYF